MGSEIKAGAEIKALHIKLLDQTLKKAFSDNAEKPLRLLFKEVDSPDDTHFSLDMRVLGIEDMLPPTDDVVELDKLTAFDLHFDFDLATFVDKTVLVISSSATRLFNALFVPFTKIECVAEPFEEQWKIAITGIEEREEEVDLSDFEEIQY